MSRTAKENYLCMAKGELPDHVMFYNMGMTTYTDETPTRAIAPNIFNETRRSADGGTDIWGVNYVTNEETGFAALPEPNNFIMKDIADWEKILIPPKMPDIDWEMMAKADYAKTDIDRTQSAVSSNCSSIGPFQQLIAFMGFNEGLCALYEDPDTVRDMLHFLADFYVPIIEKTLDAYKPDIFTIADDSAAKLNPFFSPAIFKDVFMPIYTKLLQPANDRGIIIQYHNCGRCEDFLDDMMSIGIKYWEPAQTDNDLLAIKAKYGRDLVICGGWDWEAPINWPEYDEEAIRQTVRDSIDRLAPGGAYAFRGRAIGTYQDPVAAEICEMIELECYNYGRNYYNK